MTHQALRIASDTEAVDMEAAELAAAGFLTALGIDITREELQDTPGRMARAYAELFDARPLRLTTFPNDEGYDDLVLARAIPFQTVCEHHPARSARPRIEDGHLDAARHAAFRPAIKSRILRPGRRTKLTIHYGGIVRP